MDHNQDEVWLEEHDLVKGAEVQDVSVVHVVHLR